MTIQKQDNYKEKIIELARGVNKEVDVAATGLTGYVGAATLFRLLNAGLKVRVLTRDINKLAVHGVYADHENLQIVEAKDGINESSLRALFKGAKVCLHAAALADPAWVKANPTEAKAANLDLTRSVVNSVHKEAGDDSTLIFLSSLSVYGGARSLCYAKTVPSPNTEYAHQKVECEKMVLNSKEKSLILRPGTCVGVPTMGLGSESKVELAYREDLYFNSVVADAVRQQFGVVSKKSNKTNGALQLRPYIHVDDLGILIARICFSCVNNSAMPKIMNAVSPYGNLNKHDIFALVKNRFPAYDLELDDVLDIDDPRDCSVAYELSALGFECHKSDPEMWVKEVSNYHKEREFSFSVL